MSSSPESRPSVSRRRLNTSSEEAYAGPSLTDLSTSPLSSPRIKRVRREKSRSDESETLSSNISLITEDFRCAGPVYIPLPRTQNFIRQEVSDTWYELKVGHLVSKILKEQNLRVVWVYPLLVTSEDQAADYTIIEVLDESVDDRWIKAAEAVLSLLQNLGFRDMNVEIVNELGLVETTSSPISVTEPLVINWATVKPHILQALHPNLTWLSIDVLNRNRDLTVSKRIISTPSIVIRIDRNSQENWTIQRNRIDSFLQKNKDYAHFAVEFIRASDERFVDFDLEPHQQEQHGQGRLWQTTGYMGASIGLVRTDILSGSGTCGCFLQLRSGTSVDCYALTNSHVVIPIKGSEREDKQPSHISHWAKHGIRPTDVRREEFLINMPSRADHQASLMDCEQNVRDIKQELIGGNSYDRIQDMMDEGIDLGSVMAKSHRNQFMFRKKELETLQQCISKAKLRYEPDTNAAFGQVYAASGLRRSCGKIMDWALLEIYPDRKPQGNQFPVGLAPTLPRAISVMSAHSAPIPSEEVFKIGRSTGVSAGTINAIKRTSNVGGWQVKDDGSYEYETGTCWTIVRTSKVRPFCLPGDSGSAVFNRRGSFKGLLFGGETKPPVGDVSLFISAEDLFDDIRAITGADSVELLQNEDD